jgi:hypothetical protein
MWPYVVAFIAALLMWKYGKDSITPNVKDLLSTTGGIGASIAGFLLTAASILVTIRGSWFLKRAKQAGVYESLVRNLIVAVCWALAIAVLSAVGLLFDPRWNLSWYGIASAIWCFGAVSAVGTTIRVIRTFSKLLTLISGEQEP